MIHTKLIHVVMVNVGSASQRYPALHVLQTNYWYRPALTLHRVNTKLGSNNQLIRPITLPYLANWQTYPGEVVAFAGDRIHSGFDGL